MRRTKAVVAVAATAAVAVFAPNAVAQEDVTPKFHISPGVLAIGQVLEVWIDEKTCPGGPDGGVTSPGFSPPVTTSGAQASATSKPGTYTATLKCMGSTKTGTAEFTVLDRVSAKFRLIPEKPRPGETFRAVVDPIGCPSGPFVFASTGFRDAYRPNLLEGVVVDTPGHYSVTIQCWLGRNLIKGGGMFEIAAPEVQSPDEGVQAPDGQTPQHPPAVDQSQPRKPIVKPKGAPQTGGGGTA